MVLGVVTSLPPYSCSAQFCISLFIRSASLGLFRRRLMNTGQPSRSEFSAAAARLDNNCCMPSGGGSVPAKPGNEDSSWRFKSSSVNRIGNTQCLYQGQVLHWTTAWASSRTSLICNRSYWTLELGGIAHQSRPIRW